MFGFLLDLSTFKRTRFESSLRGVNGYTGRGDVAFAMWPSGKRKLDIDLRGVAGKLAEVYADGALAATINLNDGRATQSFNTRRGDAVPNLSQGAHIDIRQNGQVILEGEFDTQ